MAYMSMPDPPPTGEAWRLQLFQQVLGGGDAEFAAFFDVELVDDPDANLSRWFHPDLETNS